MGGPNSTGISRAPAYSGFLIAVDTPSPTGLSPSTVGFPNTVQLTYTFCNCMDSLQLILSRPYNPGVRNACRLTRTRFGLLPFRSPLLRESLRFLLYPATEMFHFADFAPAWRVSNLRWRGYPIRIPPDQWPLAPLRSFSQLTASFLADKCQGILRVPLVLFSPNIQIAFYSIVMVRRENLHLPLVEMIGFEPTTHGLQSHCSPTELHPLKNYTKLGGPRRTRTSDLAVISRVL